MPANNDPAITTLAPAAIAFVISPEYLTPPSAITGISYSAAAFEQFITAVICGTPIPVTTLVVHMEPGPIPTLMQSAPALIRSMVASAVATFPAIT